MGLTRRGVGAVPAAIVLALAAGCSGGGGGSAAGGGETDTLRLGMTADIQGYSMKIQPSYQGWFADAVWDTVLICDAENNLSPQVADEWEFSEDSRSVTLHVRDGLTFSDGSRVDAEDIKASAEAASTVNARFEGLTFDIVDEQNLTITWPKPQAVMASRLCELTVTSSEYVEKNDFEADPVGSGPYLLDKANTVRGSVYRLTKREDYVDADVYPFQKLELKVLESETAGINALKTGQIDGVLASAATIDEVKSSGLEAVTMRGATTRLLLTDHGGETIPALGDIRVRQAMNMVFDREAIAGQLYRGNASPATQIFREGTDAYIEGLDDPYPYDVEKAKHLMAEAGYADGFDLEIPSMSGQNHELLIPYVTEQLGLINIRVKEAPQTGPDAIANILSGEYPVPLWQLGNFGDSRQDIVDYVLDSGLWNVSHQPDETVDRLWKTVLTGSEDEAVQAQKDINQYVIDQAWFVPMAYPDGFYAYSPDISIPTVSDFSQLHPLLRDFQK